jgi:hypothetical protein
MVADFYREPLIRPLSVWNWIRYPSYLISWSHWLPEGALLFSVASWGLMNPGISCGRLTIRTNFLTYINDIYHY